MDEFERQEILNEFLIKWMGGLSSKTAERELMSKGITQSDLSYCRKVFEKWVDMKTSWSEITKIK